MNKSKRISERNKDIDFNKSYDLLKAIELLKERSKVKFDETVDLAFDCNIDPKKGEQVIRAVASLPQGSGKNIRVAVFSMNQENLDEAKKAGASVYGGKDLVQEVAQGRLDFDLCIATPDIMGEMGKSLGKVLGPRGLMPNPKLGTVTKEISKAVNEAIKGQASLKSDKTGVIHAHIGKLSFSAEALKENFQSVWTRLQELRPSSLKGPLIKKAYISSTMGFALALDTASSIE